MLPIQVCPYLIKVTKQQHMMQVQIDKFSTTRTLGILNMSMTFYNNTVVNKVCQFMCWQRHVG